MEEHANTKTATTAREESHQQEQQQLVSHDYAEGENFDKESFKSRSQVDASASKTGEQPGISRSNTQILEPRISEEPTTTPSQGTAGIDDSKLVYVPVTTIRPTGFKGPLREQCRIGHPSVKLIIGITAYNEDGDELKQTIRAVASNLDDISAKYGIGTKEILTILILDGRQKMSSSMEQYLMNTLGVYDKSVLLSAYRGDPVTCHVFEKTVELPKYSSQASSFQPLSLLIAVKEKNGGKLNSHLWLFQAFCRCLNPKYCCLLDVGTCPKKAAIGRLYYTLEENPQVGGCAGEIRVRDPRLLQVLESSQHFDYKVSHLLDKTMESVFGYISVLPGAFCIFRWEAIQGQPLIRYFRLEEQSIDKVGPFLANMYLAEDRVLCLEVVAKKECNYTLTFVKDAVATTDVPERMLELIKQRRRWLNGAFFSLVFYILKASSMLKDTNHSVVRRFGFLIQFLYYLLVLLLNWFSVSSLFLSFMIILKNALAGVSGQDLILLAFGFIYVGCLGLQVLLALLVKVQDVQRTYFVISIFYGLCSLLALALGTWYMASGGVTEIFFIAALAGFGSYMAGAILHRQILAVVSVFLQYIFMMPTYLNIFTVYSFANLNDISWGTKEGNLSTQIAASVTKKSSKTQTKKIYDNSEHGDADLIALQNAIKQQILSLKIAANVSDESASDIESLTPKKIWIDALEEAEEDRFRCEIAKKKRAIAKKQEKSKLIFSAFRTDMLIFWSLSNSALVYSVLHWDLLNYFGFFVAGAIVFTSGLKLIGVLLYYVEQPVRFVWYKLFRCPRHKMSEKLEVETAFDAPSSSSNVADDSVVIVPTEEDVEPEANDMEVHDVDTLSENDELPDWVIKGRERVKLINQGKLVEAEIARSVYQKVVADEGFADTKILDYIPYVRSLADPSNVPLRIQRAGYSLKLLCYIDLDLFFSSTEECERTILSVLDNFVYLVENGIPAEQLSIVVFASNKELMDANLCAFFHHQLKLFDPQLMLSTHRGMDVGCHIFERSVSVKGDYAIPFAFLLPESYEGVADRFQFFRGMFSKNMSVQYVSTIPSSTFPRQDALYQLMLTMDHYSKSDACVARAECADVELLNLFQSSEDWYHGFSQALLQPASCLFGYTEIPESTLSMCRWSSVDSVSNHGMSNRLPRVFDMVLSLELNSVVRSMVTEGKESNGTILYCHKAVFDQVEKATIEKFFFSQSRTWLISYFKGLERVKEILTCWPNLTTSVWHKFGLMFQIFWYIPMIMTYSLGPALLYLLQYHALIQAFDHVDGDRWILFLWNAAYFAAGIIQFLVATSSSAEMFSSTVLCCVFIHSGFLVATLILLGFLTWGGLSGDSTVNWLLLKGVGGIIGIPLICSVLWGQTWRFFSRGLQFLLLLPSYVNAVPLYSMCHDKWLSVCMARTAIHQNNAIISTTIGEGPDVQASPRLYSSAEYVANAERKVQLLQSCKRGERAHCERLQRELDIKKKIRDTSYFLTSILKVADADNHKQQNLNQNQTMLKNQQFYKSVVSLFQVKMIFLWISMNILVAGLLIGFHLERYGALTAIAVPLAYVVPLGFFSVLKKLWTILLSIVRALFCQYKHSHVSPIGSTKHKQKFGTKPSFQVDRTTENRQTDIDELLEGAMFMEQNILKQITSKRRQE